MLPRGVIGRLARYDCGAAAARRRSKVVEAAARKLALMVEGCGAWRLGAEDR